jgi:hypothetical protein
MGSRFLLEGISNGHVSPNWRLFYSRKRFAGLPQPDHSRPNHKAKPGRFRKYAEVPVARN